MARRTDEEKAARKIRRKAKRARTWDDIRRVVKRAVELAEWLFPERGVGSLRHKWVTAAVKLIKTPAGDKVEEAAIRYLIELAVERL